MAKFLILFVAALAFTAALAAPKKNHQRTTVGEDIVSNIVNIGKNVTDFIEKNLPNKEAINKQIIADSEKLAKTFETSLKTLKEQIDAQKGPIDDALKQIYDKASESVANFRKMFGQDTANRVDELRHETQTKLKVVFADMSNLAEAIQRNFEPVRNQFQQFAEGILKDIATGAQNFKQQIDSIIDQPKHAGPK